MRISDKQQYRLYLDSDRRALGRRNKIREYVLDDIWSFQRSLRRVEYLTNCGGNKALLVLAKIRFRRLSRRLGFSIPPNTFGPGLAIAHVGNIVVNGDARIGANCRIHVGVNIGTAAGQRSAAPKLGNNCYIGPGAKLFGPIKIGDKTVIGANAVVNKSFPGGHLTLGGVPAVIISRKTSDGLLRVGYENETSVTP